VIKVQMEIKVLLGIKDLRDTKVLQAFKEIKDQ
jgi:hypothetical protein